MGSAFLTTKCKYTAESHSAQVRRCAVTLRTDKKSLPLSGVMINEVHHQSHVSSSQKSEAQTSSRTKADANDSGP